MSQLLLASDPPPSAWQQIPSTYLYAGLVALLFVVLWVSGHIKNVTDIKLPGWVSLKFRKEKPPPPDASSAPAPAMPAVSAPTRAPAPTSPVIDTTVFKPVATEIALRNRAEAKSLARHEQKLREAEELFLANEIVGAKKIYDQLYQKDSTCFEAKFGIARVLEASNDIGAALKSYWQAAKIASDRESRAKVEQKIDSFCTLARATQKVLELLRAERGAPKIFFFPHLPEPLELAKHLAALSNADGGAILVGIDPETRKPSGIHFDGQFDLVVTSACTTYCVDPCLFERLACKSPHCKLLLVFGDPANRNRVKVDGEGSVVFVPDGRGGIAKAPKEPKKASAKKKGEPEGT